MMVRRALRPALVGALLTVACGVWAQPAGGGLIALGRVQTGQWQLREAGGVNRSLCLRDPVALFQLRNRGGACTRFVIDNSPASATVHYTCPGAGHSRTTVLVETPRLVRIESQGMDGGMPFAVEMEGRRTGACAAGG